MQFAPALAGKAVGLIQFIYLPFLVVRTFWLQAGWGAIVDDAIFALLVLATIVNTVDYARTMAGLLRRPARPAPGTPAGG